MLLVAATALFLQILKCSTTDHGKTCVDLHSPEECVGKRIFGYVLEVTCQNQTTVSISFGPENEKDENDIELVTIQYTCNGIDNSKGHTYTIISESEELSGKLITIRNNAFAQGYCNFTGCTKQTRKRCWQYISVVKEISCAPHLSHVSSSSSTSSSISPSPTLLQLVSPTPSPSPSSMIFLSQFLSESPNHSFTLSPLKSSLSTSVQKNTSIYTTFTSSPSVNTTVAGDLSQNTSIYTTFTTSPSVNIPNTVAGDLSRSSDILALSLSSVGLTILSVISLFALLLLFVACKRRCKKASVNGIADIKLSQLREMESNSYVPEFTAKEQKNTKGSVLTLIQSLDYRKYSPTHSIPLCQENTEAPLSPKLLRHNKEEVTSPDNVLKEKNDSVDGISDFQRPRSHTLSLPSVLSCTSSLQKDECHYSSQVVPDAACCLPFDTPKRVVSGSTHDQLSASLPSVYEVITVNEHNETMSEYSSKRHTHTSTSSSGYESTWPIHENTISKNDFICSLDEGYVDLQGFKDSAAVANVISE